MVLSSSPSSLIQFLLISTMSFSLQHSLAVSPAMDPQELETLFRVMEALSSDQNWRTSYPNPCLPGSSWPGIQCKNSPTGIIGGSSHFHVYRLDLGTPPNPSCKNSATFPPEIFQLPNLESIFISQCFNHSPTRISVPLENPQFNSPLQQLSLRANPALIGEIPPRISAMKALQIVTLSQNSLTGSVPVGVFSLTSLVHLDLSYNLLTGSIPFEVGNLVSLVGLDLSYNNLVGPIPSSIGRLELLQKIDLSSNYLTGRIPATFQHLNSLAFLALSNNKFSGEFPGGLSGLKNLQYFIMDDNPMFVSLPEVLGQLKRLQEIRLSNSGYSGTIPPAYSELKNLSTLSLQNNRLSGGIPAGFASLSLIFHLNLSRNSLDGAVPFNSSFFKRLGRNLDLSGNEGLCLSPAAAADGVDVGVGVCGNVMSGLETSEVTLKSSTWVDIAAAMVYLIFLSHTSVVLLL
ncbi:receptor like protein 29-like [Andrographis paniculata]|uniref:receptor like protein 29-like n=1 Tax=Andrographis paniculata TaxID=175694 RepID=UPI0021E7E805|nr:receptor like protein 29-like [Andrographis paniculata]